MMVQGESLVTVAADISQRCAPRYELLIHTYHGCTKCLRTLSEDIMQAQRERPKHFFWAKLIYGASLKLIPSWTYVSSL